ncbi:DegT/DnrJ/EryC1/StrS family aminotransferase [Rhizobium leguminosarum]|uniref:DegT/DnrJ/EryC1/StrS family aminotransferase n=1 Tax=Rhizobium leguminosarum TaxID=384 RepID=UPI001C945B58|nr:DegT/DnrJ/EryC1/StrS family aminotransferase [Rhizobium leguminosarum]MBY5394883.1 DegT/DnrJ/EryC1/StrS family aminotransferase [Rhizobium leguminosarum]
MSVQHGREWPWVSCKAMDRVNDLMRQGHLFEFDRGPVVTELEQAMSSYFQVPFVVATSSGTSALHSAFIALNIAPGDEVIVPTYTFHATATPLFLCGATPVLCDSEAETGNIDAVDIEARITERTRAIVVTHMWGHPAEMHAIMTVARNRGLPVVEDAAHAVGSWYHGRRTGSLADIGIVSLGGAKMVTGGMGGALLTSNREYYERAVVLGHSHERSRRSNLREPYHALAECGFGANYRISVLAAAICIEQFKDVEQRIALKTENFHTISRILDSAGIFRTPACRPNTTRGGWYGYKAFFLPENAHEVSLDRLIAALKAEGLKVSKPTTRPLHSSQAFCGSAIQLAQYDSVSHLRRQFRSGDFPVARRLYKTVIGFTDSYFHEECPEILEMYAAAIKKVMKNLDRLRDSRP